jgi:hypothetical protein
VTALKVAQFIDRIKKEEEPINLKNYLEKLEKNEINEQEYIEKCNWIKHLKEMKRRY